MSDGADKEIARPFDPFELMTALLLGMGAMGAAVAGLQSSQWGGKQLDAFAEANTLTTKAATQYNEDTVLMNADYSAVATAKEHLIQAREAKTPGERNMHLELASYFYTTLLTHNAYKTMHLPEKFYVPDEDDEKPGTGEATESESVNGDIPDAALMASLHEELDDAYSHEMLETGTKMFGDADKKFAEGRQANENGDRFELIGVFFTVAMFFAGLGLVFKTSIRWGFIAAGAAVFIGSAAYMAMLPWAS